jgi:magnesium-transporting ATPase (P-type)
MKFPFSSARKRMSVIVNYKGENLIFVKGASEMVLSTCNKWYNMEENKIEDINEHAKAKMESSILEMASKSLRTLCIGYKKLGPHDDLETKD